MRRSARRMVFIGDGMDDLRRNIPWQSGFLRLEQASERYVEGLRCAGSKVLHELLLGSAASFALRSSAVGDELAIDLTHQDPLLVADHRVSFPSRSRDPAARGHAFQEPLRLIDGEGGFAGDLPQLDE